MKVITGPGGTIKQAASIGGATVKVTDNATTLAPLPRDNDRSTDK
jgi:hypothetical protein